MSNAFLIVAVSAVIALVCHVDADAGRLCQPDGTACVSLGAVDLRLQANAREHHTDSYEKAAKVLIVRRNQAFNITIGQTGLDQQRHQLRAVVSFGTEQTSNGHVVPLGGDFESTEKWAGRVVEVTKDALVVQIRPPVNAAVAPHVMRFELHAKGVQQPLTLQVQEPFYVLFNPWSEQDAVYMPRQDMMQEYVMSDSGVVYQGYNGKKWIYGQFVEVVFDAVFYLMELSQLNEADSGDIVKVSRMMSWLVNANDGVGVIAGKWSEPYDDGRKPWEWSSSVQILSEFYKTHEAVRYGQCWVFASTLTTVARTLGIPARPVSNVGSAHDTDDSLTIDKFLDNDMNEIEQSGDSTWNFHVWTETWFSRSDIDNVYSGWQVIDATPQEQSDGLMQAGPGSVAAVQRGDVDNQFDLHFIWSEVSSLTVVWTPDERQPLGWRKTKMTEEETGIAVLTKKMGRVNGFSVEDAEDITYEYKHRDATERRDALANAFKRAGVELLYEDGELGAHEVECELAKISKTMIGGGFVVTVKATNKADKPLTVNAMVRVNSNYYNGVRANEIGKQTWSKKLSPGQSTTFEVNVTPNIYIGKLVEHSLVKIFAAITVVETDQIWTADQDVQFQKPQLQVTPTSAAHVGQPIKLRVQFTNPMPTTLTNCRLTAEGYTRYDEFPVNDIPANGQLDTEITVYVDRANYREKVIVFHADQLQDVWGTVYLNIVG